MNRRYWVVLYLLTCGWLLLLDNGDHAHLVPILIWLHMATVALWRIADVLSRAYPPDDTPDGER